MLLLCFCFKSLDLFDQQTTQFDFSPSTLFVIFTSSGLKLWVKSLHPKQYVVPGCFPIFIGFIFDCVFYVFCNLVKCFWHIVLILLVLSLQLFFQSLQYFINHLIHCFFSSNFDMYKFILPTNLKRSK